MVWLSPHDLDENRGAAPLACCNGSRWLMRATRGLTPLTLSHVDVWHAGRLLGEVMASGEWRRPEFSVRAAVT